jgi:hypothetical protein
MPPFGTCFQSKVGPGYALQAATQGIAKRATRQTRFTAVWPSRSLAPTRSRLPLFRSAWFHGRNGGNNDMEGAAERTLSVGPGTRTSSREDDVFRILSKRTRVI